MKLIRISNYDLDVMPRKDLFLNGLLFMFTDPENNTEENIDF